MWKLTKVAAVAAALAAAVAAHAGEVEVLHYWTSGGEAKSAAELKKMMQAKGHTWRDFAVAGGGGDSAMTVLKSRVISGNPPSAAQVKGPAIQEWASEGVLGNMDALAKSEKWDEALPKVVADVMKYKGNYVAAPVNVHRVNWMWANPEVLKKAGVSGMPKTWDEFMATCRKIEDAGYIPILMNISVFSDWCTDLFFDQLYNNLLPGIDLVRDPKREAYLQGYLDWDEICFLHDRGYFKPDGLDIPAALRHAMEHRGSL